MKSNNLYHLKNYVNKSKRENIDETYYFVFNYLIDIFPNVNWVSDTFFNDLDYQTPSWIIIYTVLTYNSNTFINNHYLFKDALCNNIIKHKISYFQLKDIINFFLDESMQKIITSALENKYITPNYIINSILNSFPSSKLNNNKNKILNITQNYINNFNYNMFNNNYDFFNIYNCLKDLWNNYLILELPNTNIKVLEYLPRFNELISKERIKQDFLAIEKKDTSVSSKFQDCLTIINRYSYELN